MFLPVIAAMLVGTIGGGILLSKLRYWFPFYLVGTVIGFLGSIFLYFSQIDTSVVKICVFGAMTGFSAGLYSQIGFTIIAGKVPRHRIGYAIGFLSVAQIFGSTVPVAIGETIVINLAMSKLAKILPDAPTPVLKGLIGGTSDTLLSTLPAPIRQAVIEAIVSSIDKAYILGIAAGAIGIICTLFLPHERIDNSEVRLRSLEA